MPAEPPPAPSPAPSPAPRPRILVVGGNSGRSGVPTYIRQLCTALAGVADLSIASDGMGPGFAFAAAMGLPHHAVPGLARSRDPRGPLAAARGLAALIAGGGYDLIWANSALPVTLCRLLAWRGGAGFPRLVVTCHGAPFGPGRRPLVSALARAVEGGLLARVPPHDVIFLSDADRRAYGPHLARHRAWVVPNTADLGRSDPVAPDRPTVLMTSRWARQKDLGAAARIFAALPGDHALVLLGEGTDAPGLRALFARHLDAGALARVAFVGAVGPDRLRRALAGADLLLMTSRYEGMPIGALEAFAQGLPVALTDVGGTAEIRAAHPRAVVIDTADPAAAARAVAAAVARHRARRAAETALIRAAWDDRFAPGPWQDRMRDLLARIQARPPGGAAGDAGR